MLEKTVRPSSTPVTMLAKLSSRRTIWAASRATSVPVAPIAMPTSAARSAGASLTPSPVMATSRPIRLSASTIFSFCRGVVRAKTLTPSFRRSTSSTSRIDSSASPVSTAWGGESGRRMPACSAMARAVTG
jgi:hypothetical protein